MTRPLLRAGAALLLALASAAGWGQNARPAQRYPTALSCDEPAWDIDALGYELEGETQVIFDLDDRGRPINVRTARGSGWSLLDTMSERAVGTCRFPPPGDPQLRRRGIKTAYTWALEPPTEKLTPAFLVAGSCPASDQFDSFLPLSGQSPFQEGMRVRLLVTPDGQPFAIRFEPDVPPATQQAGAAYLESCRFQPAQNAAGPANGRILGRLMPKPR